MRRSFAFAPALFLVAIVGCGDDSETDPTTTSSQTSSSASSSSSGETTGSGAGGEGGEGGAGGAGAGPAGEGGFDPGEPVEAPPEEWTWVEAEGARCADGSPTGFGINPSGSNDEDLVIFLQGGGACFNQTTCFLAEALDGYGPDEFADEIDLQGDFLSREATDAWSDWSFVFVPYCTGDIHAGHAVTEVGGSERDFHGYRNVTRLLERVVPTFPNLKRVLLTGVSAGGFGAFYNYEQVKAAVGPGVTVTLVDDSGPPLAAAYFSECLQRKMRDLWGLDGTLPQDCDACFESGVMAEPYLEYLLEKYADQRFGLISSEEDGTIRQFFGYGLEDCAEIDAPQPPGYGGSVYTEGLYDIRDRITDDNPFFHSFFLPGSQHVWLSSNGLDGSVEGSPTVREWVGQMVTESQDWTDWPQ